MSQQFETKSLYNYVIDRFHNKDPKKRNKKTVLFANIIHNIKEIVEYKNNNPVSAKLKSKALRRVIGMLSDNQRIYLIIRLICYLYLMPFLRISIVSLLVIFRLYHVSNPEFIDTRLNNSPIVASIWSNYKPITNQQKLYNLDILQTSNTKAILIRKVAKNLYNMQHRINQIGNELYKSYNQTQYLGFSYGHTTRNTNSKTNTNINKTVKTIKESSLIKQIKISAPSKIAPKTHQQNTNMRMRKQINIPKKMLEQKNKIANKNYKKYNNGKHGKYSKHGNDYISGYIFPERNIVAVVENGKVYLYQLPRYLIEEYQAMMS